MGGFLLSASGLRKEGRKRRRKEDVRFLFAVVLRCWFGWLQYTVSNEKFPVRITAVMSIV